MDIFFILGHRFDCPVIGLSVQPILPNYNWIIKNPTSSSYIPHGYSAYTDHMNFLQRLMNSVFYIFTVSFHNTVAIPKYQKQLTALYEATNINPVPTYKEIIQRLSLIFTESHFSAAHVRPDLPNIINVAGIHIGPDKPLPEVNVHTMPHSRMQHNEVLPPDKNFSAYAAKLIMSALKNDFLPTIFQFTKTVNEKHVHIICHTKNYIYTTVDDKYQCGKPVMITTLCWLNFHTVWCSATCHSMQKLCWSHTVLTSTLFSAFATQQSCIVLHSAMQHNVDTSLHIWSIIYCLLSYSIPSYTLYAHFIAQYKRKVLLSSW